MDVSPLIFNCRVRTFRAEGQAHGGLNVSGPVAVHRAVRVAAVVEDDAAAKREAAVLEPEVAAGAEELCVIKARVELNGG